MLCEARQKPVSRQGQGRRAALQAVTSPRVPEALGNKRMELGPDGGRGGAGRGCAQTRARLFRVAPALRRGSWSVSSSEATLS